MEGIIGLRPMARMDTFSLPRAAAAPELEQAAPAPANPVDQFTPSAELQRQGMLTGPQVLQQFGADRKKAVTTALAASGGKPPENPELPWYGKLLKPFLGGKTKTASKQLGPDQEVTTKFKVKNFKLKDLRLSTTEAGADGAQRIRHIDFDVHRPGNGRTGEIKHAGEIMAKGQAKRMFEQEVKPGSVVSNYYDPKTGQRFLQTTELSDRQGTTRFGTVRSAKNKNTYRQIDILGDNGQLAQRYSFDYGQKQYRMELFDTAGNSIYSQPISGKTDYFKLVDNLSMNPPSARQAPPAVGQAA